jgi:hypothetical protein
MKGIRWVVLAGTLVGGGCGGAMVDEAIAGARPARAGSKVADEHFARIPVENLDEVEQTREEVRQRRDARVRAEHEVAVDAQAVQVAEARVIAAIAQEQVANEARELAKKKGERGGIEDAGATVDRREAERRLAEANAEAARRRQSLSEAELELAKARVHVAEAELEDAKYAALVESNDAAADRYDAGDFREAIEQARRTLRGHEVAVKVAREGVEKSVSRAEDLERELDRVPVRGHDDSRPPEEDLDEDLNPVPTPTPFR